MRFFFIVFLISPQIFAQNDDIYKKGLIAMEKQVYDSATYYFEKYIKNNESNNAQKALAYLQLGIIQSSLKNPILSIQFVNKSLELDEQYIYYFYRGRFNYQHKKIAKAIKDYDKAIELKPDFGGSYTWKGIAKYWQGKIEEGCFFISKGATLGDEEAMKIKSSLKCK
jgi:tetratricopeptide (TPR) repeat protein